MGNTNTNSKHRNERPYSIDVYPNHSTLERRCDSPRNEDSKAFDFGGPGGGKRRPVLCYQNSTDYGGDDQIVDFKVNDLSYLVVLCCVCVWVMIIIVVDGIGFL